MPNVFTRTPTSNTSRRRRRMRRAGRARSMDVARGATEFYPHLLAGSFKREAREDVVRQLNLPPLPPALEEATKNKWEPDYRVPETSFTAKQEGLADFDPRDTASIEERYQKLRKLREELNLPVEGAESSALNSLRSGSLGLGAGGTAAGYGAEKDSYMSERTTRTMAASGGPEEASSYSFRSAKMNGNAGGATEGYKYKAESSSTSEYKRGGDQGTTEYRFRSERGATGDQNSLEYKPRSERTAAGDQGSTYEYKSRLNRGGDGDQSSTYDYKSRLNRGGDGDQKTYEYKTRTERGGGDQNSYEYKYKTESSAAQNNSYEYKPRSERGADSGSDYKSRFELKSDDYKSKAVDFDLPKTDRKKDDYSFSSSNDRKTERFSSLSSSTASASKEKSLASSSKVDEKELDDDNVSDMMKKLPSSQEILERISKMELDD
ncbi:uncharacterized protein LOC123510417 [Portunus trituberculatus]|uniref:uncharacterized protein LOC123510417 n=1 Tax=Portunus trituberculatus TaxID=210409 RepID=UPI001E1D17E1|nr:uncharacterized protein LOC123510417 [Portunus trituberculatus]